MLDALGIEVSLSDIFLKFVNLSISASWVVLAVLIVRVLLKKAPKWLSPILWSLVGLRLILPFPMESVLSLIPSAETIDTEKFMVRPYIDSGIAIVDDPVNHYLVDRYHEGVSVPANHFANVTTVLGVVWLLGIGVLLVYTFSSYYRLRKQVTPAISLGNHVFESNQIFSPFVLGLFHPHIYLPVGLSQQERGHVIAHEETHIRRHDHWIKPLGFVLLSLYWFNPMMWAAYILMCRDIELACDEQVIRQLSPEQRADYSQALLNCSVSRRRIAACPLAFGEIGVRERIKNVLSYKKPAFWIIALAICSCIVVAVCFLTNPVKDARQLQTLSFDGQSQAQVWYQQGQDIPLSDRDMAHLEQILHSLEDRSVSKNKGHSGITPEYGLHITMEDKTYQINQAQCIYGNLELISGEQHYWVNSPELQAFIVSFLPYDYQPQEQSWEQILMPGTAYVPYQCLYMNPLSSFLPAGGDSGCRYLVQENAFSIIDRSTGEETRIPVSQWQWQPFPYTEEQWNALGVPIGSTIFPIHGVYDELLYQPLDAEAFLVQADGNLWLVKLASGKLMRTYLWSIYTLVPEPAMGKATWEGIVHYDSHLPVFPFAFDTEKAKITAVCTQGSLADWGGTGEKSASITVPAGNHLWWDPADEQGNLATQTDIHFTVQTDEGAAYSGTIYITSSRGKGRFPLYTARIVGTGLYLSQSTKEEGGIIAFSPLSS